MVACLLSPTSKGQPCPHLSVAHLYAAHLSVAHLYAAHLSVAHLYAAHLSVAHLYAAHLSVAHQYVAHLDATSSPIREFILKCLIQVWWIMDSCIDQLPNSVPKRTARPTVCLRTTLRHGTETHKKHYLLIVVPVTLHFSPMDNAKYAFQINKQTSIVAVLHTIYQFWSRTPNASPCKKFKLVKKCS